MCAVNALAAWKYNINFGRLLKEPKILDRVSISFFLSYHYQRRSPLKSSIITLSAVNNLYIHSVGKIIDTMGQIQVLRSIKGQEHEV